MIVIVSGVGMSRTLPKCPVCEDGMVENPNEQGHPRLPCKWCNGTGLVSLKTLECIVRKLKSNGEVVLECKIKEADGGND